MQSSNTNLMHSVMEAGRRNTFFSRYLLLFAVLIFCVYQYSIHKIFGFSLYPDEFGYWASAAGWIGYDWSGAASLGSYYSFGYSLLLAPILKLCRDGVSAYRAAVTLNMLMQCVCTGLLWGIFKRLCHTKETAVIFAVGAAVFYPVWSFYTQMTMAEALLVFFYVFICYQFVILFEKPKMISVMILSLSFLYLYFIHMRTVGVVLAAIAVMALYLWHEPKYRRFLVFSTAVLLIGAGCGLWIKKQVTGSVYAAADAALLSVNDYAGQAGHLKRLLTGEGIISLLKSLAGKIYYLGMASFGLFYAAVFCCAKRAAALLRNIFLKPRKPAEERMEEAEEEQAAEQQAAGQPQDWLSLFLVLSMLGQLFVSAIYTEAFGRLDGIVYGRYNEYLLPVFIGIGVLVLFENGHLFRHFQISAGISSALFGVVLWSAAHSEATLMYGFHAAGLNYLPENAGPYQAVPEFCKSYLFGLMLMAFMAGCIAIAGKSRRNLFMICPVLLVEIALTVCLSKKYTWYFNDMDYQDLKIYEYIEEEEAAAQYEAGKEYGREDGECRVTYLYGGGRQYIDLIQFVMQDRTIAILQEQDSSDEKLLWEELKSTLPDEGFLIADIDSGYLEKLEEKYKKCMETASFVLFSTE